jgi:predicted nucleotidyltransferase
MGVVDPLAAEMRRRVLAGIHADLEREHAESERLRSHVVPIVAAMVRAARARGECGRAWLFGSFAWGRPASRSDVDLLVEDCAAPDRLAAEIWRAVDRPVHVLVAARAPESLLERVQLEGRAL